MGFKQRDHLLLLHPVKFVACNSLAGVVTSNHTHNRCCYRYVDIVRDGA